MFLYHAWICKHFYSGKDCQLRIEESSSIEECLFDEESPYDSISSIDRIPQPKCQKLVRKLKRKLLHETADMIKQSGLSIPFEERPKGQTVGKFSEEEEKYAADLICGFETSTLLDVENGTSIVSDFFVN